MLLRKIKIKSAIEENKNYIEENKN